MSQVMSRSSFVADVDLCKQIAWKAEVAATDGVPNWQAAAKVAALRGKSYREQWSLVVRNGWFDLMLRDGSVFQFEWHGEKPIKATYRFWEVPYCAIEKREFRQSEHYVPDDEYATLDEQYETYVDTLPSKQHVLPLRYDADPANYKSGQHPASHLHVGFDSKPRIATARYWRPLSFLLFTFRQMYPEQWGRVVGCHSERQCIQTVRSNLCDVPSHFFNSADMGEVFLK